MASATQGGGTRSGASGSYMYAVKPAVPGVGPGVGAYTYGDKPVVFVSFSDARRFAVSRFSRALRDGFVARRRRGTTSACASRERSRSSASSRLRDWDRESCATAVTRGPQRAITRRFWSSDNAPDEPTSKTASIREAVTFACCPPGPDERLARTSISLSGISTPRAT